MSDRPLIYDLMEACAEFAGANMRRIPKPGATAEENGVWLEEIVGYARANDWLHLAKRVIEIDDKLLASLNQEKVDGEKGN